MTGWASALGGPVPQPAARRPAARRCRDAPPPAGVGHLDAERIDRFARGHPLSLKLAASALQNRPDVSIEAITVQAIVEELTELYLDVLDPMTRRALDAAAVVRRPTMSLLAAMLPEAAPQDAFDRLLALPFVEVSDDGLVAARHRPRNGRGASALVGSRPLATVSSSGMAPAPRRGRRVHRTTSCGGTRLTCSTSSRTRSSGRRSSRRPSTSSRRSSPGHPTARRSPRSSRRGSRRLRSRSSTRGGAASPGRSASCATGRVRSPGSTSWPSSII